MVINPSKMEPNNNDIVAQEKEIQLILDKRNIVEGIQKDLGILMEKLNGFVADNRSSYESDEEEMEDEEKHDEPSEKAILSKDEVTSAFYIADELNPPEINWEFVGPLFQKQLDDLAKLQNLNHMMNSISKRIRNFTQDPKKFSSSTSKSKFN